MKTKLALILLPAPANCDQICSFTRNYYKDKNCKELKSKFTYQQSLDSCDVVKGKEGRKNVSCDSKHGIRTYFWSSSNTCSG